MIDTTTRLQLENGSDFCFSSMKQVPRAIRNAADRPHAPDVFTPLKRGKEWLFEYTSQYQPKTAEWLMNGGELFACGEMPGSIPLMSLYLEVNGFLLVVGMRAVFDLPDSPKYKPVTKTQRYLSLPDEISKAYYFRFDGLGIEKRPMPLGNGWFLPRAVGNPWGAADGFLARHHLRKQKLPILKEKIPGLDFTSKKSPQGWGVKFMCFLETPPEPGNPRKFDALFVKNHIQDGVIYLIHDLDVDNIMVLDSPAEAIDAYCAHNLSRAEGRFDFLKFARKL